jgi:hypothetical protein
MAYDHLAKSRHSEIGHNIIVTRGLMEWVLCFEGMLPKEKTGQYHIPAANSLPVAAEEIVILFANILQEAISYGIQSKNYCHSTKTQGGALYTAVHNEASI